MGADPAAVKMLCKPDEAAALLQPLRLKIVKHLAEPDSATGLARKLGLPRQQINYHLHELERAGLIEFVEERRRGNCNERIVRAVAQSYLIGPDALGDLAADPDRVNDRFSAAHLVALAAKTISDLALLEPRAAKAKKRLATLSLLSEIRFGKPEDLTAFSQELTNFIASLIAKYHRDDAAQGRLYRFTLGAYPAITKRED